MALASEMPGRDEHGGRPPALGYMRISSRAIWCYARRLRIARRQHLRGGPKGTNNVPKDQ